MNASRPAKFSGVLKRYVFLGLGTVLGIFIIAESVILLYERHPVSAIVSPCVLNLRTIKSVKDLWMMENDKTTNDTPTWDDLRPLAKTCGWTNWPPICPQGGTYAIGQIGETPTCSIGGPEHSISKQ
jgi:hypothetical protein